MSLVDYFELVTCWLDPARSLDPHCLASFSSSKGVERTGFHSDSILIKEQKQDLKCDDIILVKKGIVLNN